MCPNFTMVTNNHHLMRIPQMLTDIPYKFGRNCMLG